MHRAYLAERAELAYKEINYRGEWVISLRSQAQASDYYHGE
jgi:hypothetical protein